MEPSVSDDRIAARLKRILDATSWFSSVTVRVDQGVAFLDGVADSQSHQQWAGELAQKTQGVVAVVNSMTVEETSPWDLTPAWMEIQDLASQAIKRSPLILLGLLVLALTWFATFWAARSARTVMAPRLKNELLRTVASRVAAVPILLMGFYVALRIAGLTSLAVTVLGGTGLIGLLIGVAFRDIAENFLASLMISVQNPFATGDRISVAGHEGLVQSVNTRSTLLMTLEGNHVQIPNATIYKETITNFTANPNTRFDFGVGIGYDDSIEKAQQLAREALAKQEGVVTDPESWVVVEALGAATINLRIYFWVNTAKFNGLKVRSAVIRSVKRAYVQAGISMPDEAREVVFPSGVPVRMVTDTPGPQPQVSAAPPADAHEAEGSLASETEEIAEQAQRARAPEGGPNLLNR
ncbi:MAG: mechanosensitive ion channel [Acidobacteria bacterium]|nr:mechanosensitive ion channel [Acidobacteriota bacterium]